MDESSSPAAARSAKFRAFFARHVAALGGAQDPRIEAAFAAVPREPFAGPGPWSIRVAGPLRGGPRPGPRYLRTPDDDPAFLYQDVLIALDIERGIHLGVASLHAACLEALAVRSGETVLQVGAGSGYYTAILAELVGPGGRVCGYEIVPDLAERACANLAPWPWVSLVAGSGAGQKLPTADIVYVNAGITQPNWAWLDALAPGGRLLFPLQQLGGRGAMLLVEKPGQGGSAWPARFLFRSRFIACQARQDDQAGRALTAAFERGGWREVRSLRLAGPPDSSCWFDGGPWWLSTAPAERPGSGP
jgi:protein-L-isoaspartate(D-aspartate) O-methyltransferase